MMRDAASLKKRNICNPLFILVTEVQMIRMSSKYHPKKIKGPRNNAFKRLLKPTAVSQNVFCIFDQFQHERFYHWLALAKSSKVSCLSIIELSW